MRAVHGDLPGGRWHTWERLQMPWRMRRDRVAVYHGTYNTLPPRWRLWPGPPMVVSLHDVIVTWWPDDLGDPFVRYARAVTRRVVRDATLILTVSEWSRKEICERFAADPAKVRLSLAGGCALNSVANGKIFEKTGFREVYVQPAAGDDGTAIGAAFFVQHAVLRQPRTFVMEHAYTGPEFANGQIHRLVRSSDFDWREMSEDELTRVAAQAIADGKIVGVLT